MSRERELRDDSREDLDALDDSEEQQHKNLSGGIFFGGRGER